MTKVSVLIIFFLFFAFYILHSTFYINPVLAQCLPPQATNPRVQNGLITTPSFTAINKFGSDTGQCVQSNLATFVPLLPTYEDLKSKYYTQSKATKNPTASTTIDPIGTTEDGKVFDYTASDVEVRTPFIYKGTALIFIEGNIKISQKIIVSPSSQDKGLVFIVKGKVFIDKSVSEIDAVIISQNIIYTATDNSVVSPTCVTNDVSANALIINGSLVSLDPGSIIFCRELSNNIQAAEQINNQPKYLVILRDLMSDTLQKWSEIQ